MNFRNVIGRISRHLPPAFVSDRFLPWLSVLLAVAGGFWTITEYRNDLAIERVKTTLAMHSVWLDKQKGESFIKTRPDLPTMQRALVRSTCHSIEPVLRKRTEPEPDLAALDCDAPTPDWAKVVMMHQMTPKQRKPVRKEMLALKAKLTVPNEEALERASQFLRSVLVCVEAKNCDASTTVALFARSMTIFVNDVCVFIEADPRNSKADTIALAKFLVAHKVNRNIYWSTDTGRTNLFACDYLRKFDSRRS